LYDRWEAGERTCITSPTGGGKTRCILEIAKKCSEVGWRCIIFTHRKLITSQSSNVFGELGLDHGIIAAGYEGWPIMGTQIASIWTINSRYMKGDGPELPPADVVIFDEAHGQTFEVARKVMAHYRSTDAKIIGFTATPVGLGGIYDHLIIAGTNSELRAVGALLPCRTFAPTEIDLSRMRRMQNDEFVAADIQARMKLSVICGRVIESYREYNPENQPGIVFGPSLGGSVYLRDKFIAAGYRAAHMDYKTTMEERADIIAASKAGDLDIITNFFLMREGLDLPWLKIMVLANSFGSISNFLQAGGRLLRNHPSLSEVVLQDHGSSFANFGSLNMDRSWRLRDTNSSIRKARKKEQEGRKEDDPTEICCPKCKGYRFAGTGSECPHCGYVSGRGVRVVLQVDGTLKEMKGPPVKRKYIPSEKEKRLTTSIFVAARANLTVAQMLGLHWKKHRESIPQVFQTTTGKRVKLPGNRSQKASEAFPWAAGRKK
jgi:superfamily II DNA or RNA helicase